MNESDSRYGVSQIRSELFRKPMRTRRIGPHIAHGQRRSPFRSPMYEASFGRHPDLARSAGVGTTTHLVAKDLLGNNVLLLPVRG